jgi:hypothetical protein
MKRTVICQIGFYMIISCLSFSLPSIAAEKRGERSTGQLVYVPAYSHIYSGDKERAFLLTVTLSIRNIDPHHSIQVVLADYYETQGELLKGFIEKPATLKPLESLRYVIPERDKSGGSGANFLVKWRSNVPVTPPILETIMIGTQNQQGISFTSRGREILPSE